MQEKFYKRLPPPIFFEMPLTAGKINMPVDLSYLSAQCL
jgi:hypothetical protein